MIKTIIFDFGDVLVRDTTKTLEKKYKFDSLPKAKQTAYIKAFHKSEVGQWSSAELLKTIHKTLAPQLSPKEIENFIIHTPVLPPWKLTQKLSKHYKIIIFSNNQKTWPRKIAKLLGINFFKFPWLNSAYIGMRKPNVQFYRFLLKKFKLKPEETVFVDDKLKNLIPAKKLGIHTFQYVNNIQELEKFLKKLNIKL